MKSATYEINGCRGSQKWVQTGTFNSMPEAMTAARKANQRVADGLGISMAAYRYRNEGAEGWTVAAGVGSDGVKV